MTILNAGEKYGATENLIWLVGMQNRSATPESSMTAFSKVKHTLVITPNNLFLGIFPGEMKIYCLHKNLYMFIAALFIITKN